MHRRRQRLSRPESGYRGLADFVADLVSQAGLIGRLREFESSADSLESLAADAAKQWTAGFNPRKVRRRTICTISIKLRFERQRHRSI